MGEYNVQYGKKNRGLTVVHSYRYLVGSKCTEDGVRLAMILGWCVEWVRICLLAASVAQRQMNSLYGFLPLLFFSEHSVVLFIFFCFWLRVLDLAGEQ